MPETTDQNIPGLHPGVQAGGFNVPDLRYSNEGRDAGWQDNASAGLLHPNSTSAHNPAIDPSGRFSKVDPSGQFAKVDPSGQFAKIDPSGQFAKVDPSGQFGPVDPSGQFGPVDASGRPGPQEQTLGQGFKDPSGQFGPVSSSDRFASVSPGPSQRSPWQNQAQYGRPPAPTRAPQPQPQAQPASQPPKSAAPQLPVLKMKERKPDPLPEPGPSLEPEPPTSSVKKKRSSRILTIGIIACIVAVVILMLSILVVIFKPFGLFAEDFHAEPPSTSVAQRAFESSTIPIPDLSSYRFVDARSITRDSLGNFDVGSVEYTSGGAKRDAVCEANALATYSNDYITVSQSLAMTMTYDKESETWQGAEPKTLRLSIKPTAPPNLSEIVSSFPTLLKSYDAKLATMYVNATIEQESTLTKDGGIIVFKLKKKQDDDKEIQCEANAEVSWNEKNGWVVKISSITGDVGTAEEQPKTETPPASPNNEQPPANENNNNNGNNNGNNSGGSGGSGGNSGGGTITTETVITTTDSGGGTVMQLICYTGELVEVPGQIQFDSSGRILLRTTTPIRVIIDGRTYNTEYFEVVGNGKWSNGQLTAVIGEVSATGSLGHAPIVINTSY